MEFLPIEGIWVEPGPVRQERVLLAIQVIPVLPAKRIVAAMGVGGHGADTLDYDIRGKDRIHVIEHLILDNSLVVKMEKVLHRMNTRVGTGGAGEGDGLSVEDLQGFFHFLLDRGGVVLDLKSAIPGAFVGDF